MSGRSGKSGWSAYNAKVALKEVLKCKDGPENLQEERWDQALVLQTLNEIGQMEDQRRRDAIEKLIQKMDPGLPDQEAGHWAQLRAAYRKAQHDAARWKSKYKNMTFFLECQACATCGRQVKPEPFPAGPEPHAVPA